MDVSHNIVTSLFLFGSSDLELLLIQVLHNHNISSVKGFQLVLTRRLGKERKSEAYKVGLHLFDGFVWDRQSQLLFSDRQVQP